MSDTTHPSIQDIPSCRLVSTQADSKRVHTESPNSPIGQSDIFQKPEIGIRVRVVKPNDGDVARDGTKRSSAENESAGQNQRKDSAAASRNRRNAVAALRKAQRHRPTQTTRKYGGNTQLCCRRDDAKFKPAPGNVGSDQPSAVNARNEGAGQRSRSRKVQRHRAPIARHRIGVAARFAHLTYSTRTAPEHRAQNCIPTFSPRAALRNTKKIPLWARTNHEQERERETHSLTEIRPPLLLRSRQHFLISMFS
ncbi:hypothetical protein C8R45DRAFT_1071960 [Mycena sanguinolenta]|nr:hypothetical protein C8R45DRAFT_1071960 [Mycena sanguinolenta]